MANVTLSEESKATFFAHLIEEVKRLQLHRLIVAVDYGTTYSGVSYVTSNMSGGIDDVNNIRTWPGSGRDVAERWKVPSRIAYKSENTKCTSDHWGFEVTPTMKSYSWTKLLLDRETKPTDFDDPSIHSAIGEGIMLLPSHRSAEGVCEDFLRHLYKFSVEKFKREMSAETFDSTPMDCWITMPAIWSDKAQAATYTAAKNAGWGSRVNDTINMIPEPEAAAIATLIKCTEPRALDALKPNENILICDCGGGTVDITSYTITQSQPQLQFKELCVGVGGKCGSTFIDRNFHSLMSRRFGRAFENLDQKVKGPGSRFMRSFEDVKCDFGASTSTELKEISPFVMNVEDSEYYDSETHAVFLSNADLHNLFSPVVSDIINLIDHQVKDAKAKANARISRIILVGGFD